MNPPGAARCAALPPMPAVVAFALAAAVIAAAAPVLAYAGSLALFGAPHALAELRYVDGTFSRRLGAGRGAAIAVALLVVVALRAATLAGAVSSADAIVLELGLVALLAFVVVPDLARRPMRAAVAVGVGAAVAAGSLLAPIETVVVLALLHNATPVGFLLAREDTRRGALRPALLVFVVVPLLIATGLPARALAPLADMLPSAEFAGPAAGHLRAFVPPGVLGTDAAIPIFSAAAYMQILHYGVVLLVLPGLLRSGDDAPRLPWPRALPLAIGIAVAGALFSFAFFADFAETRRAYGLLAAVHAWIEIPVLLLALAPVEGAVRNPPAPAAA